MARGAWIRWAGLIVLAMAGWSCGEIPQEPSAETVSLAIVPSFEGGGGSSAAVDQLRIVVDQQRSGGEFTTVADTTVAIDTRTDSVAIDIEVPLLQDPQIFRVTLQASLEGIVLYSGTSQVSIPRSNASSTSTVDVPIAYAGPPFQSMTLSPRDTIVLPGATFALNAFVTDSLGAQIVAPVVSFKLLNPLDSTQLTVAETGTVTVASNALTTSVIVIAETPDSLVDQALIQIGDFTNRRRWVVDPGRAQPYPTQWGTDSYPFSTINRALNRAGIRDTVSVAIATYNETLSGDRPVILLGDSNATGMPTVMSAGPSGAILSFTGPVDLRRMRFQGATGPLTMRGTTLNISSVVFTDLSGPALAITQSGPTIIQGITISNIAGGPLGRGIQVASTAGLNLRSASISTTDAAGVRADSMGFVHVAQSEIQQTGLVNDTVFGIEVAFTDSVRIDSVRVHDTNGGGIGVGGATILTARGDSIWRTHANATEPNGFTDRTAFFAQDVLSGRIVGASITDNTAASVFVLFTTVDGSVAIDSSILSGDYWAVRGFTFSGVTTSGRVSVVGNTITGRITGPQTRAIGLGPMRTMIVQGNQIDSVFGEGIFPAPGDTVIIRNNTLLDVRPFDSTAVVTSLGTRIARIDSNFVQCATGSDAFGIAYYDGSGMIDFNNVVGCRFGGFSNSLGGNYDLFIRSNFFTTGQGPTLPAMGYQVQGPGYHVEMIGNSVSGGVYDPFGGLVALGGTGSMRSVRMSQNIVQSGTGRGLSLFNIDTVLVDSNMVSFMDSVPGNVLPAVQSEDIRTTGRFAHNQVTNNATQGFYFRGVATGVRVDSNTIAGNAGPGIWLDAATTLGVDSVAARFNVISGQVSWGALVTGMGGNFQNNDFMGNGFAGLDNQHPTLMIDATLSYWNNALGPQCLGLLTGCDAQTSGDFVSGTFVGAVNFIPVSATPNLTLPGPARSTETAPALPTSPGAVRWILRGDAAARLDGGKQVVGGGRPRPTGRTLSGFPR